MTDDYERIKAYRVRRRERARIYLGSVCVVCGSTDNLHFDHIDPSTKVLDIAHAIARAWSWERLVVELDKCQLLCEPHHIEKSQVELDGGRVPHGGGLSGKKNCPCVPCKARKREYMIVYKANRGLSKLVEERA